MEAVAEARTFYLVGTIAIAVVAIVVLIALVYIILLLRDALYVSKKVKEESDLIKNDIDALRASLKAEASKLQGFLGVVKSIFGKRISRKGKN